MNFSEKESDAEFLRRTGQVYKQMLDQASQIVVGQQSVFEGLTIALASRGHCLLAGAPGLATTAIVGTLARLFGLEFRRLTLTPDMTPNDVVPGNAQQADGTPVVDGPLATSLLLVEDIACAPPKTQTALLNAIRDECVTIGQVRRPLPKPFFVVATETPVEREGLSLLTASQRDCFMMKLVAGYPTFEEEFELVRRMAKSDEQMVQPVFSKEDLLRLQETVPRSPVGDEVAQCAVTMIRKTRVDDHTEKTFAFMPQQVAYGAGTRALQDLIRAAQARATLNGRTRTAKNDLRFVSKPVLRHRLVMQPDASLSSDDVIEQLD